eukprot:g1147.t1
MKKKTKQKVMMMRSFCSVCVRITLRVSLLHPFAEFGQAGRQPQGDSMHLHKHGPCTRSWFKPKSVQSSLPIAFPSASTRSGADDM